jgi:glucuronokinase
MLAPVTASAYSRAGLLGNPSDGYGGKAIALSLYDFRAQVTIEPADRFAILPASSDGLEFDSFIDASRHFREVGCDDGLRLIRAAIARFAGHWEGYDRSEGDAPRMRFTISHATSIPRQVGLAGSSAIVIAVLRALCNWFGTAIPPFAMAELALEAELEELGIAAGAMDRVIQSYEGFMAMDLREPRSESAYVRLDPSRLPPLFVAWDPRGGEASGRAHGDLRARWLRGDPEVLRAIDCFRDFVDRGVACLRAGDAEGLRELVDRNFELRTRIFAVGERDREMVAIARERGAAANLCGSGGAVIGVPREASDLAGLAADYRAAGYSSLRPQVTQAEPGP